MSLDNDVQTTMQQQGLGATIKDKATSAASTILGYAQSTSRNGWFKGAITAAATYPIAKQFKDSSLTKEDIEEMTSGIAGTVAGYFLGPKALDKVKGFLKEQGQTYTTEELVKLGAGTIGVSLLGGGLGYVAVEKLLEKAGSPEPRAFDARNVQAYNTSVIPATAAFLSIFDQGKSIVNEATISGLAVGGGAIVAGPKAIELFRDLKGKDYDAVQGKIAQAEKILGGAIGAATFGTVTYKGITNVIDKP